LAWFLRICLLRSRSSALSPTPAAASDDVDEPFGDGGGCSDGGGCQIGAICGCKSGCDGGGGC
jgi:hypothetical protein